MLGLPLFLRYPRLATFVFLTATAITTVAAADWSDQVGLQLESVHAGMSRDLTGTLNQVHNFGFKYVELVGDYNMTAESLKTEMASHQLTAISAHFPYARFRDDPEGVANEAVHLGLKLVGCPALPQKQALDLAGCQAAIAVFNHAGEILAQRHIQFFYHPHGYEFKPYADGTFFDLIAAQTNPQFVHFQMDVFWIVHGGQDPLKLFDKYGDRWISMHIKDMKKGERTGLFTGHADKSAFVPLGQGQIDITAVIQAGHKAGIKWFFLEDESAAPLKGIPQSILYLQNMAW